jgi:hypothetical protein
MLKSKYTPEEIEVRIWGFVVVMITIILFGIVIALLYSVTFVTQPIRSMAPIDQAYTKMLNDIVLLIVGGIGGIVGKRAVGAVTAAINPAPSPAPAPAAPAPTTPPVPAAPVQNTFGALPVWTNPPLDESWSPPPPPTTPPSLEDDAERELQAEARASVK